MGFPRASGDGPFSELRAYTGRAFPPRERGWSRPKAGQSQVLGVSPARAGMVLRRVEGRKHRRRFPRASGDGPVFTVWSARKDEFPPRERGWSLKGILLAAHKSVSPARAGMVPRSASGWSPAMRFPRASGDGPCTGVIDSDYRGFPPRERGWSQA